MKFLLTLSLLVSTSAFAADVLVRYNNALNNDSDSFAQCLIDNSGKVTIIAQGLQVVQIKHRVTTDVQLKELKAFLKQKPLSKKEADYGGYNFLALESVERSMFASYSTDAHQSTYFEVPEKASFSKLVEKICKID